MRILSQDGMIFNDIPYEKFILGIARDRDRETDTFCIVAQKEYIISESGFPLNNVIAKYSTKAKARKAMVMLRNTYSPKIEIKEPISKEIPKLRSGDWIWATTEPKIDNFYFKFPRDDEVET